MNTFGQCFRISIFGESHGEATGVVVDGCPAGLPLATDDFLVDLQRRRAGQQGTTQRREQDRPKIISGVYNGHSTGAPIAILFENNDIRPDDYAQCRHIPRPGHADFAAIKKWNNYNDLRGGGHLSGRLTVALVAAGVIAKKLIAPVLLHASLEEAGGSENISEAVMQAVHTNNTIGGIIQCTAKNIPAGAGSPFFNSIESLVSHLVFSIPGIKGIEFGAGFGAARMTGAQHNDPLIATDGKTATNNAGGITGGLANGNDLVFRVAVKPASSISTTQTSMNITTGKMETFTVVGRHDACFALRLPVIVEAVTAIALAEVLPLHCTV